MDQKIKEIRAKIEKICKQNNLDADKIMLLAVTKTHSAEIVSEGIKNGLVYIGENKIQEAEQKLPLLTEKFQEFHYIGHLQSNKINKLMKLKPTLIHSIDKLSTVKKLNKYLAENNIEQDILIQVNTSNEESKFGIDPEDAISFVNDVKELKNIHIKGLMTIGTNTNDESEIRRCFRDLRILSENIKAKFPDLDMKYLSMGMSSDFEIAIEEGANIVRLGSIIFGNRDYSK